MEQTAADKSNRETLISEQIRLHGRLLFRLAFKVLRNSAKAEEACQQVVLKAMQMHSQLRNQQAMRGWLARSVVNESLTILRRERSDRRACEIRAARTQHLSSSEHAHESREIINNALQDLPELTQAIVVLRLMQGMSGNEVKDLLGVSASDVSRKLHQGMDHLRERLQVEFAVEQ